VWPAITIPSETSLLEALHETIATIAGDPASFLTGAGPDPLALDRDVETARAAVETIKRKRHRLGLALADGVMTADVYRSTDDELVDQLKAAAAQLAQAQAARLAIPSPEERRTVLDDLVARFEQDPDWLLGDPPRVASARLKRYGLQIWCRDGQVVDVAFTA
jgi:hypothetical protein